jgi:hypothetical protein
MRKQADLQSAPFGRSGTPPFSNPKNLFLERECKIIAIFRNSQIKRKNFSNKKAQKRILSFF